MFFNANILGNLGSAPPSFGAGTGVPSQTPSLPVTVPSHPTPGSKGGQAFFVAHGALDAVDAFMEPIRNLENTLTKINEINHQLAVRKFEKQYGRVPDYLVSGSESVRREKVREAQNSYMLSHLHQETQNQPSGAAKMNTIIDQIVVDAVSPLRPK